MFLKVSLCLICDPVLLWSILTGEIISVQTCAVRFHSQHCGMDPDRMFWMAENPEDVHICYFFRIFFLQDMHNNQSLPPKPSFIGNSPDEAFEVAHYFE